VHQGEAGGTVVELTFEDPEAEGGPVPPDNPFRSIEPDNERAVRPSEPASIPVANHVE
jgi:hypothetical protein